MHNGNLKEQYEEQVKKLGLQYYVQFLGYRRDIPELLKISDVAVASSRREGLPVNVMEAMATGLPLVVTNCRGQRELICDGENGFIVGIDDTEGFANAVEELYKSRETRRKFGKRSNEFSKSYSLDKVMQEMEEVYSTYLDF